MPIPNETIRLQLSRYGDRWDLAGALRGRGYAALEQDGELVSTVARDLADVADHPPGVVLEAIARELDRRETERITAAVAATTDERTPLERLADDQRAAAQDDPRGEADR